MPALTVSGSPYTPGNAPATTGLSGGYFVVLDAFSAPDAGVLAELTALVAPKKTARKGDTHEPA